jgi:hypothetical protein
LTGAIETEVVVKRSAVKEKPAMSKIDMAG